MILENYSGKAAHSLSLHLFSTKHIFWQMTKNSKGTDPKIQMRQTETTPKQNTKVKTTEVRHKRTTTGGSADNKTVPPNTHTQQES